MKFLIWSFRIVFTSPWKILDPYELWTETDYSPKQKT